MFEIISAHSFKLSGIFYLRQFSSTCSSYTYKGLHEFLCLLLDILYSFCETSVLFLRYRRKTQKLRKIGLFLAPLPVSSSLRLLEPNA